MKGKLDRSFRTEIIIYSLLSLVFTLITEIILFGAIYLVVKIVSPAYSGQMGVTSSDANVNDNLNQGYTSTFEQYRFREDINISLRFNREMFIVVIALAIIIGIALFVLYFILLTRKFTRQLENISIGIQEIEAGNFKHRIPTKNINEFGIISINLNKMAYKLQKNDEANENNEKNKNALITSLTHDLRTPLTSINGYLDLLANNPSLPGETRNHYMEIVYNKSKDLENLIDDIFDYTRVSLGEINVHYTEINMVQFINQIVDEFYPGFRENNLEYTVKIEGAPIYVEGDGDLLARAINNLVSNAIKYGKDGKMINLYLRKEDDKVILLVVNYGQLIPQKELPYLFERFYRVEGSRSADTGGTGLGLSIAKEIIELHDGTIKAKSDNNGTVFEVILPAKGGDKNE